MMTDELNAKYDIEAITDEMQEYGLSQTIDESLAQAINVLTETQKKKILSELEHREVFYVALLYTQSKEFDDDLLNDFLKQFLILRISKERKGRKEIVEIAKANLKVQSKGLLKKLFGKKSE